MSAPTGAAPSRKRRWLRAVLYVTGITVVLAGACAGGAYYIFYDQVQRQGVPGDIVRIEIPSGASGDQVADILAEHRLVRDPMFFRLALRLDESHASIKAGEYDLPQGLSANQLLEILYEGPNVAFSPESLPPDQVVTMPEGLTVRQMAELMESPESFLDAAQNLDLSARLGIETESPEGFLMPNTYYFDEPPSAETVVSRMVEQFSQEWDKLLNETPEPPLNNPLDIVTVASLVEEEARVEEERPVIAAVIYNRLEQGMPLGMDSTLQYALNKYGQRMLNEDKEVDSPYNTYKHAGLPPGPISNPGVGSLRAALNPADVDYLYFVSNADGKTHTFSRTLQEHNRAVARYRREIAEQRRELKAQQLTNGDTGQ